MHLQHLFKSLCLEHPIPVEDDLAFIPVVLVFRWVGLLDLFYIDGVSPLLSQP